MNRQQKKCLIATVGFHLLLVVILIVGPGFFRQTPKPDDTQVLEIIPTTAIDDAASSGVKNAKPPAPAPTPMIEPPKPIVVPTPPQPQPEPTPPPPVTRPATPDTSLMEKMEHFFKSEPVTPAPSPDDSAKPAEHKPKHEVKVDLTTVTRTAVEKSQPHRKSDDSQQREAQERASAVAKALRAISENSSTATEVDMPGNSSASYANYGAIVVSMYHRAWRSPDNMSAATAVVRFSVTIARDGTVISAHIVTSSGDANVDDAVQRMLDRVSFIHPFPEDTKDKERTYNIDFDATRTSML
jgi:periplasmic protein TonB